MSLAHAMPGRSAEFAVGQANAFAPHQGDFRTRQDEFVSAMEDAEFSSAMQARNDDFDRRRAMAIEGSVCAHGLATRDGSCEHSLNTFGPKLEEIEPEIIIVPVEFSRPHGTCCCLRSGYDMERESYARRLRSLAARIDALLELQGMGPVRFESKSNPSKGVILSEIPE